MSDKTISVIIPSYNHASSLSECFESLFTQTRQPLEIIIVDDGSTDDTRGAVEPYLDQVRYIYQENGGAPKARNRGFQESSGDYVIFCDADAILEPEMLEKMAQALDHDSELSFAYSGFFWGWKKFLGQQFSKEQLRKMNFIHTTSLIRRSDFPGFDEAIKRLQDWDLWLTMVKNGKRGQCVSKEPLFQLRIDGPSRIGSFWVPKIFYKLPWQIIGWAPKPVAKYRQAREVLKKKHAEIA